MTITNVTSRKFNQSPIRGGGLGGYSIGNGGVVAHGLLPPTVNGRPGAGGGAFPVRLPGHPPLAPPSACGGSDVPPRRTARLDEPASAGAGNTNRTADGPAAEPPEGAESVTPDEVYVHRPRVGLPKWQGWAKAAREPLNPIIEDAHFPSPTEPPTWQHHHDA